MDLGSNSFKMTVAQWAPELSRSQPFRVLHKERHPIQLGAGVFKIGHLSPKDQKEAMRALEKMQARLRDFSAPILRVVATSAIRDASNGRDFVREVQAKLGLPIEVISGTEEARLIAAGLHWEFPKLKRGALVDIGGGSSEVSTFGDGWKEAFQHSFKVGSVRVATMFCDSKSRIDLDRSRRFVAQNLARFAPPQRVDRLIGSAGSIQSLGRILSPGRSTPQVKKSTLDRWIAQHLKATANDLRKDFDLTESRARVVVPGAIILSEVLGWLKMDEIVVTGMTLRDGVMVDLVRNWQAEKNLLERRTLQPTSKLMRTMHERELLKFLEDVAIRFRVDVAEGRHTAALALALFDQMLENGFSFSAEERRYLLVAAYLHNIGRIVASSGLQKHGAYILRNIVIPGFSDLDSKKAAAILYYHRKEAPPKKDPLWEGVGGHHAQQVRRMTALLRLVSGLDEKQNQNILSLKLKVSRKQANLELLQSNSDTLDLNHFRDKASYFEELFDLKLISFVHPKRKA